MKLRNIGILVAAVIMIAATGIGNAFAYTLTYSGTMSFDEVYTARLTKNLFLFFTLPRKISYV